MDTGPTLMEKPIPATPTPSAPNGCRILHQTVRIPDLKRLNSEEDIRGALQVLEVRMIILSREATIRELQGRRLRCEAEIGQCEHRLKHDKKLTEWQRKDLKGRILETQARREECEWKTVQYQMEIRVHFARLKSEAK